MPIVRVDQVRLIALLNCKADNGNTIGLWLEAIADGRYRRLSGYRLVTMSADEVEEAELLSIYLIIKTSMRPRNLIRSMNLWLAMFSQTDRCTLLVL
jgi:hypothetical protein